MQDVMDPMDIAFPHLGIYLRNVPQSFSIFGFQIALYGVIVASAFLVSLLIAAEVGKRTRQNDKHLIALARPRKSFSLLTVSLYEIFLSAQNFEFLNTAERIQQHAGFFCRFLKLFLSKFLGLLS